MSIETVTKGTSSSASALLETPREDNRLTQILAEQSEQEFADTSSSIADYRTASTQGSMASRTADLREFIAFEFSLVPKVECVFTAFRENQIFYAWIVINEFDSEAREDIYYRQQAIIDEFLMFEFDFYIVARTGRKFDDIVGDPSMDRTYARD